MTLALKGAPGMQEKCGTIGAAFARITGSLAARAFLAIGLSELCAFAAMVPPRLGPTGSFAVASASAALAILLLLSLCDDDASVHRIARRMAMLLDRTPSADHRHGIPAFGMRGLESSTSDVADLLTSIEHRLLHRHPISGLPTREPLFAAIAGASHGMLGVLHLADIDRLHAFDERLAEHVLVTQSDRVTRMLGDRVLIAQIDRARLAFWFGADTAPDVAVTKLQAVGYALGESILFEEREILPKVHASSALKQEGSPLPAQLLALATMSGDDQASHPASPAVDDADPLQAVKDRFALEQDLRRAVARGELALAFQPLVDAQAGVVCGAEALLRWHHPTGGLVSPARFVPIMEEAGLAAEIGLWALNAACREAQDWRRQGLGPLRVAVNISGKQIDGGNLGALVERTLARHALTSDMLEIELTETIATGGNDRVAALFAELRRLGVAVAIDDFGTGYSSFSTLRTVRFDKIKIDREFVTDVDRQRESQAICRSILALGQGLGIRVLAEGVETEAEYNWLRAQGCRYFQGYYFAQPLAPEAFRAFVRDTDHLAGRIEPASIPSPERLRA